MRGLVTAQGPMARSGEVAVDLANKRPPGDCNLLDTLLPGLSLLSMAKIGLIGNTAGEL